MPAWMPAPLPAQLSLSVDPRRSGSATKYWLRLCTWNRQRLVGVGVLRFEEARCRSCALLGVHYRTGLVHSTMHQLG